ncbi:MAG: cytochrome P450 [Streptosporangiales bacterium]|nr:cytochrome P450 [Streptosporangiales bacterium]
MSEPAAPPHLGELLTTPDRDGFLADLAGRGPVSRAVYLDGTPVWLVTGHAECSAILTDTRFSSDINTRKDALDVAATASFPEDVQPFLTSTLGAYDPPDHTRLRKLVSKGFTARRINELRPRIQQIVDELLTELDGHEEIDAIEGFAYPLPIRVICELLGVPADDVHRWRSWSAGLVAPDPDEIATSARSLIAYMQELIATKKAAGDHDDLIGTLVQVREDDGDRLSDEELISVSLIILLAGHETTVSVLSQGGVLLLLTRPEQLALLRAEPDRVPAAVEEMLRYAGPAEIAPMRYAREDIALGGVTIRAGEPVQLVYATANRDQAAFELPDEARFDRADNPHLAFGHGIHFCLGAALARAEADIAFRSLLARFPDLALAVPADRLTWLPGIARRLSALPVRPHG